MCRTVEHIRSLLSHQFLSFPAQFSCEVQELGHTTRTAAQDQNQGHPQAMRMHCGWMG